MVKNEKKLTSVKVDVDLLQEYKVESVRTKFSIQKLVERAMHLYLNDEEFKRKIRNHNTLK